MHHAARWVWTIALVLVPSLAPRAMATPDEVPPAAASTAIAPPHQEDAPLQAAPPPETGRAPAAGAPTSTGPSPATVPGTWYGWQIMLADFGAIGLLAGGAALTSDSSAFAFIPIVGGVTYFADAPIVYAAHGDSARIPWSLGRRILFPAVLFGVGFGIGVLAGQPSATASGDRDCPATCVGGVVGTFGFGIGMLGAMIYDWVTASAPDRPAVPQAATKAVSWAPVVVLGQRNQMVGVVVHF